YKIELRGLYNVIPHIQCIVYFICRQEGLIKNVRKGEPELYNSIRHLENFYKDKVKSSWISKDYYNKVDTIINVLPTPMNPKDFKTGQLQIPWDYLEVIELYDGDFNTYKKNCIIQHPKQHPVVNNIYYS